MSVGGSQNMPYYVTIGTNVPYWRGEIYAGEQSLQISYLSKQKTN